MLHFKAVDGNKTPEIGDLLRSRNTGNFVNIVLGVSETLTDEYGKFIAIRSVRYASTAEGYLNGTRSRSFKWRLREPSDSNYNDWEVVEEFKLFKNEEYRAGIIARLKDVETAYQTPEENDDEEV